MKLSSILFKYAHPYVLLCYLHILLAFSAVICMFLRGNLLSRKPLHRRGFFFRSCFANLVSASRVHYSEGEARDEKGTKRKDTFYANFW